MPNTADIKIAQTIQMHLLTNPSNSSLESSQYAAIDAVTLLEAGFARAALQTVRQFGLLYEDIVNASSLIGNRETCAKAQALFLLGVSSTDSLNAAQAQGGISK